MKKEQNLGKANSFGKSKSRILFPAIGLFLVLIGVYLIFPVNNSVVIVPGQSPSSLQNSAVATITKVIDGDSVVLSTGEEVRYIGIDAPEVQSGGCFATEAAKANSDLVLGKEIKLSKDASETDKYGRLLRYVYVDGVFINDYLVRNGYAKVMTISPDTKFSDKFILSENYAKENKLGLWRECPQK